MNILDENIVEPERAKLFAAGVPTRQIGVEIGYKTMRDEAIRPLLHELRRPTFFTRDLGWYQREFCHRGYGVVCLDVVEERTAEFIRRILRHPDFRTQRQRMGMVVRAAQGGIRAWQLNEGDELHFEWPP